MVEGIQSSVENAKGMPLGVDAAIRLDARLTSQLRAWQDFVAAALEDANTAQRPEVSLDHVVPWQLIRYWPDYGEFVAQLDFAQGIAISAICLTESPKLASELEFCEKALKRIEWMPFLEGLPGPLAPKDFFRAIRRTIPSIRPTWVAIGQSGGALMGRVTISTFAPYAGVSVRTLARLRDVGVLKKRGKRKDGYITARSALRYHWERPRLVGIRNAKLREVAVLWRMLFAQPSAGKALPRYDAPNRAAALDSWLPWSGCEVPAKLSELTDPLSADQLKLLQGLLWARAHKGGAARAEHELLEAKLVEFAIHCAKDASGPRDGGDLDRSFVKIVANLLPPSASCPRCQCLFITRFGEVVDRRLPSRSQGGPRAAQEHFDISSVSKQITRIQEHTDEVDPRDQARLAAIHDRLSNGTITAQDAITQLGTIVRGNAELLDALQGGPSVGPAFGDVADFSNRSAHDADGGGNVGFEVMFAPSGTGDVRCRQCGHAGRRVVDPDALEGCMVYWRTLAVKLASLGKATGMTEDDLRKLWACLNADEGGGLGTRASGVDFLDVAAVLQRSSPNARRAWHRLVAQFGEKRVWHELLPGLIDAQAAVFTTAQHLAGHAGLAYRFVFPQLFQWAVARAIGDVQWRYNLLFGDTPGAVFLRSRHPAGDVQPPGVVAVPFSPLAPGGRIPFLPVVDQEP